MMQASRHGEPSGDGGGNGDGPTLVTVALEYVLLGGMETQAKWPEVDAIDSAQMERPGSPSLLGNCQT